MKRIGGLWQDLVSMDNLCEAAKRACSSRKDRSEVEAFRKDSGRNLELLRQSLIDGSYRSSEYRMFKVNENGKERLVADLPLYPDRILHWAVCLAVEGPMNKKLIDQAYGSRPGTGHHKAVCRLSEYISGDSRIRFALFMDVYHFFPSIDKETLKRKIRSVFKDWNVIHLLDVIIDDYNLPGIPIGNRTSPMLANLYLSRMDHILKEEHHCHYYMRYMDDIVVLGYSKPWLHRIKRIIDGQLRDVGLEAKDNWQIFPIDSRGVLYLGYRVYSDHIMLKKLTKERMKKAAGGISTRLQDPGYVMDGHDIGVVQSYRGVLKWCDGRNLRKNVLDPLLEANERNI